MRKAVLFLASIGAISAQAQTFIDQARVRHVEPRYESVQVPRRECGTSWIHEAPASAGPNYGGVLIGAVAGGLIGNQVGNGRGRQAATAAGAVLGAFAGDRLAASGSHHEPQRQVRSCRDVLETQSRLVGYQVTYEYRGFQHTAFTRRDPGASLPVQVTVVPHEREEYSRHGASHVTRY